MCSRCPGSMASVAERQLVLCWSVCCGARTRSVDYAVSTFCTVFSHVSRKKLCPKKVFSITKKHHLRGTLCPNKSKSYPKKSDTRLGSSSRTGLPHATHCQLHSFLLLLLPSPCFVETPPDAIIFKRIHLRLALSSVSGNPCSICCTMLCLDRSPRNHAW